MTGLKIAAVTAICVTASITSAAQAAVVFFDDRAAWETAAAPLTFSEDFSGFASDTSFRNSPVSLNGSTIQQVGNGSFRNEVDVTPTQFGDNNGTNNASLLTNAAENADPGTQVRITFDLVNSAFGFESWGANSGEGSILEIFDGGSLLDSRALTNVSGDFLGYVLTAGMTATSVLFRSATLNPGQGGEGFGIDNLAGSSNAAVAVVEPPVLALLGMGLIGLGLAARRKRIVLSA